MHTEENEIKKNNEMRKKPKSKSGSGSDDVGDMVGVYQLLAKVSSMLENACLVEDSLPGSIAQLNRALKVHGANIEKTPLFQHDLNQLMGNLKNSVRHARLDMATKLYLLEIVELHKNKWVMDTSTAVCYSYYLSKLTEEEKVKVPQTLL